MTEAPRHRKTPRLSSQSPRLLRINLLGCEDAMERERGRKIEKRLKYAQPRREGPRLIRVNLLPRETRRKETLSWKLLKRAHFLVATAAILGVLAAMTYEIYSRHPASVMQPLDKGESKKIAAKNHYLQDPFAALNAANEKFAEAQTLLENGKLELPSRKKVLEEANSAEIDLTQQAALFGAKITPAPDYLSVLFHVALANQPHRERSFQPNFRLFVCHGLESDCRGTYALSNGVIVISFEIIALAQNEAELVAILGHEIGHASNEDGRNEEAVRDFLLKNDDVAMETLQGSFLKKLKLADQKRQDAVGVETLELAGYSPCAMYNFAKRLFNFAEPERIETLEILLKNKKCDGPFFKIRTEAEFRSFKKEFLRITP